jgi:hypothetical protein
MHAYAVDHPDPVPMLPGQEAASGEWLPLVEAAPRLGCSADTVRRRLKRGALQGRQVPMQGGHRWEIFVPLIAAAPTQDLQPLVDLVRDLTVQNVELAGQVGHWQTRAQLAEERLKLLEAPPPMAAPARPPGAGWGR